LCGGRRGFRSSASASLLLLALLGARRLCAFLLPLLLLLLSPLALEKRLVQLLELILAPF